MPPAPRRRRRRSTTASLITLALVVLVLVLDRSTRTYTASTAGTSTRPSATSSLGTGTATPAATTAAPGSGATAGTSTLAATDPPHTAVQPYPAPGSCHARPEGTGTLPDPACTPGAIDPHVTQANIGSTICRRGGYTTSVRPPVRITNIEKLASMRAYSDHGSPSRYEFDHLVSLELGGSPNAPANLWPEPGNSPNPKDKIETRLHAMVCNHQITLAQAQEDIATDWVQAFTEQLGAAPAVVAAPG